MIGWPGNMHSAWNSPIPVLITRCSLHFALVWSREVLSNACWTCFSSDAGKVGGGSARGRQRTDSTHVLAKIRAPPSDLGRGSNDGLCLECADREVAPEWILAHVPAEWVERYGKRLEEERLPKEEQERRQYANQVGADGWMLLDALETADTPEWMKALPAITTLRSIWEQQFEAQEQGGQWRAEPALPAAQLINSPYDLDARNGKKRAPFWTGDIGPFHPNL